MTTLYIDADACPVKDEAYKVAARYGLHTHVVSNSWIRTPKGDPLIHSVVVDAGCADGQRSRFVVDGPPLRLPPRLALSIAMALHELGTNAVKYGALCRENGTVSITWNVDREPQALLRLRWAESGGPIVEPPTRTTAVVSTGNGS